MNSIATKRPSVTLPSHQAAPDGVPGLRRLQESASHYALNTPARTVAMLGAGTGCTAATIASIGAATWFLAPLTGGASLLATGAAAFAAARLGLEATLRTVVALDPRQHPTADRLHGDTLVGLKAVSSPRQAAAVLKALRQYEVLAPSCRQGAFEILKLANLQDALASLDPTANALDATQKSLVAQIVKEVHAKAPTYRLIRLLDTLIAAIDDDQEQVIRLQRDLEQAHALLA